LGESQIDDLIGDLEMLSNPTVGLAAHSGQVDIRITAKAESVAASDELINPIEDEIRSLLGDYIYGADQETLEEIAIRSVSEKNWTITVIEAGLGGNLIRRLAKVQGPFLGGQVLTDPASSEELMTLTNSYRLSQQADVGLGVAIHPGVDKQDVILVLITPLEKQKFTRPYGGPPEYAPIWAFHQSLDIIRRITNDT
jgi:nicotinamide-nucleotide amidase